MAEFNAGLIDGIGDFALKAQAQANAQNDKTWQNIGSLTKDLKTSFDNQAVDSALQKNFNPETQELNSKGVIADLFQSRPQQALAFQAQQQAQQLAALKGQGEYQKDMSQVGLQQAQGQKYQADTDTVKIGNDIKKYDQGLQVLKGANDQQSWDKSLEMGKKMGWTGVQMFEGKPYSPDNVAQATSMLIDAKSQAQLAIDKQNADSSQMSAGANVQNAGTNAIKATQDYSINTDKNTIDRDKNMLEARKQDLESQDKSQQRQIELNKGTNLTPEQQVSLEQKNREVALTGVEKNQEIEGKISNLKESHKAVNNFNDNLVQLRDKIAATKGQPRAWLQAQAAAGVAGTPGAEISALYNQALGATNYNTIIQSKAQGQSLGGSSSDKDMASAGATKGMVDAGSPFKLEADDMIKRLDTAIEGNKSYINDVITPSLSRFEKDKGTIANATAPVKVNKTFTAPNGMKVTGDDLNQVGLTEAQFKQMNTITKQGLRKGL